VSWDFEFTDAARKQFRKLDLTVQKRILKHLRERITEGDDPRRAASPLLGDFTGLWRYRVGDYRVICEVRDEVMIVLIVKVAHRREIYNR